MVDIDWKGLKLKKKSSIKFPARMDKFISVNNHYYINRYNYNYVPISKY